MPIVVLLLVLVAGAVLVRVLPWWAAVLAGLPVIVFVVDRVWSGPDRRLLRRFRKVLQTSDEFDGIVMACLPVIVGDVEHPPRVSDCSGCRAEEVRRTLAGRPGPVAVVTSGSLSFWKRSDRVASYPFGRLRGLRQVEGAYSLLGQLRRSPVDPDRMPLQAASKHKFLLLFDDYSGLYLQARVKWDAALFHEAYSVVSGNVAMQALSLALTARKPLPRQLGIDHGAGVLSDLRRRGLLDHADEITLAGTDELLQHWLESSQTLRFVDPTVPPENYRR
ncbi:hypothetical protein ACXJJ3_36780 [Kribbella sp. WER1]